MLKGIEVESASPGKLTCTLVVTESLCNRLGNLHGGAAAVILDCITSLALRTLARDGFWETTGVSRSLNLTYLRPAAMDTRIRVEGEVVQAGRNLAHLTGRISRVDGGETCVTGTHDKSYINPKAKL